MGVQIKIEREVLESAGWKCWLIEEYNEYYDWDTDQDKSGTREYLAITKDAYTFYSYCDDCFVADCKPSGANIDMFMEAGLLDLPHLLN